MSDIPERLYNLAKGYVEMARTRIDQIDSAALAELQSALPDSPDYVPPSGDPMERAAAKIAAARSAAGLSGQSNAPSQPASYPPALPQQGDSTQPGQQPPTGLVSMDIAAPAPADPLSTAYHVVGVPPGSDIRTVEDAVRTLRERCDPSRFPEGSAEAQDARRILSHIDDAYSVIQKSLNIESTRFDKLEL